MDEKKRIEDCFRSFIEGSLVTHDIDRVMELFSEDVMGIGMGAQGIVRCREDLRPILMNTRSDVDDSLTEIRYSNMQIRYYGGEYAGICATVTITTTSGGKRRKSHIGQCAGLRMIRGEWKINMVQATPLSIGIEDIDAYPLSFAEDEIETYRMQEQFSHVMQRNIRATYKIDFETGLIEEASAPDGRPLPAKSGDCYESKLFLSADTMLSGQIQLRFVELFSPSGLRRSYRAGQTDVSMDYEASLPDGRRLWFRNTMHLFTDIRGHLKGYLYLLDIDGQKREEIRLTRQAELDLATSVFNKETTRRKIEQAIRLHPEPMTCAFFMIDLDYFKQINDTYGHARGDEVVRETAKILKSLFRAEDIIGRLGGDEFCVFYTGRNSDEILEGKAEQICSAVRRICPEEQGKPGTSASIGIAKRTGSENFDELYWKADQALYARKTGHGRGGFSLYREDVSL
jgi:diguanylate cyclase (GGDEF)-like protein